MSTKTPFFIHIPKNMGNFVYKHYGKNPAYFGLYNSIYEYYDAYKIPNRRTLNSFYPGTKNPPYNSTISIDHLTLKEMVHLRILSITKPMLFYMIFREPIQRFISLCNYWNLSPKEIIYNIQRIAHHRQNKFVLYQHLRPQMDYVKDTQQIVSENPFCSYQILKMNKMDDMRNFFEREYPSVVSPNFNEKIYKSKETYTVADLTEKDYAFLRVYYHDDFVFYLGI